MRKVNLATEYVKLADANENATSRGRSTKYNNNRVSRRQGKPRMVTECNAWVALAQLATAA